MKKFVLEKLLHKKWMCLCLLIGNIMLLAIAICNPLYYHSALNRTLQRDLENETEYETSAVGEVYLSGALPRLKSQRLTDKYFKGRYEYWRDVPKAIEKDYGLKALEQQNILLMQSSSVTDMTMVEEVDSTLKYQFGYMNDLQEHSSLIAGEWPAKQESIDEPIECVIGERIMMKQGLMVGQEITLGQVQNAETKKPLTAKIVGVYARNEDDPYWMVDEKDLAVALFVTEDTLATLQEQAIFTGGGDPLLQTHVLFDCKQFTDYNYANLISTTKKIQNFFAKNKRFQLKTGFQECLISYKKGRNSVRMLMIILQLPLFILLALFIFMVANQMLSMEDNEIAMLKSRGASRRQILEVYGLQSLYILLVASVFAIPLGVFLCKLLGSANSFLQFVSRSSLKLQFSFDVVLFWLAGALFSTAVMVIPVLAKSKLTIVEVKQKNKKQKKSLWKKCFLDVIILSFTAYIYYNYLQQKDTLSLKIAAGGEIDYLLLLSSSMFMIGCGLLFIRILPWIIQLVFLIGKRFFSPELYASFLQVIRTSKRQEIISLFLIMTVSLGIFNATTASTINQNKEQEVDFKNGSDILLQEKFDSNYAMALYLKENQDKDIEINYTEPDYMKYQSLEDQVEQISRVYYGEDADVSTYDNEGRYSESEHINVVGIEAEAFGRSCYYREDLSKKHWYESINALTENYTGFLVSKEYAKSKDIRVGDMLWANLPDALDRKGDNYFGGVVVGFVDYWPTVEKEHTEVTEEGETNVNTNNYIIGNFDYLMSCMDVQPYKILIKTKKQNTDPVYDFVEEQQLKLEDFSDAINEKVIAKTDPILQVTNGILTVSFLVVIMLCTCGFLIYWILSIRSRELLFGIYRAMGLSRKELKKMLMNEQICSTLAALLAGVAVGVAASILYVPVMEISYLPGTHMIPLKMVIEVLNIAKLGGVLLAMVLVCILVLLRLVSRLKISQALKLGED